MGNLIDLSKKAKITLEKKGVFGEKVNVALALDISASMENLFNNGTVQEVVERILAIGMNMDINKEIDIYLFGAKAHSAGTVNEGNISGYVSKSVKPKYRLEYSTEYSGVMRMIAKDFNSFDNSKISMSKRSEKSKGFKGFLNGLFGTKKDIKSLPLNLSKQNLTAGEATIVFFITDGDNMDKNETEKFIKDVSTQSIFWQFVGIGNSSFNFLERLDDMDGRYIDNANFFAVNDIKKIKDEELYDRILNEFPSWLKESRNKGITK